MTEMQTGPRLPPKEAPPAPRRRMVGTTAMDLTFVTGKSSARRERRFIRMPFALGLSITRFPPQSRPARGVGRVEIPAEPARSAQKAQHLSMSPAWRSRMARRAGVQVWAFIAKLNQRASISVRIGA